MTQTILDRIRSKSETAAAKAEAATAEAREQYIQLLRRMAEGREQKQDAAKLEDVMAVLGIDVEAVEVDLGVVREAIEYTERLMTYPELDKARAAASRALVELQEKHRAELLEARTAYNKASHASQHADTRVELQTMARQRPSLFDDPRGHEPSLRGTGA